jgi:hypothetical protein
LRPFSGGPVRFQVCSNGGRERNRRCLLKLEGVGLLGQNVKENGLYIGTHFISHGPPSLLRRPCPLYGEK